MSRSSLVAAPQADLMAHHSGERSPVRRSGASRGRDARTGACPFRDGAPSTGGTGVDSVLGPSAGARTPGAVGARAPEAIRRGAPRHPVSRGPRLQSGRTHETSWRARLVAIMDLASSSSGVPESRCCWCAAQSLSAGFALRWFQPERPVPRVAVASSAVACDDLAKGRWCSVHWRADPGRTCTEESTCPEWARVSRAPSPITAGARLGGRLSAS